MSGRKPISINLRDLQRVLNEGKPELPRYSSGAANDKEETTGPTTYYANRESGRDSRWANHDHDDDSITRSPRREREEAPEPDFSTVRSSNNEFRKSDTTNHAADRGKRDDDEDLWRSSAKPSQRETSPEEDVWRRPNRTESKARTTSNDKMQSRQSDKFGRSVDASNEDAFNRSNVQRVESKKLYVPPTRRIEKEESGSPAVKNDRFSCLEEPYDRRNSNSSTYDSSRAREVFSMQRREPESQREYSNARDLFGSSNRESARNAHFGEPSKSGVFVPSYKRAQPQTSPLQSKPTMVHDIILKAAGITEQKESTDKKKQTEDESPKATQPKAESHIKQKIEAIRRHNRMYQVNPETLKSVEGAVLSMLNGEQIDVTEIVPEEEEELVPAVMACLLACKACESCKTMEEVIDRFHLVAPLLKELSERTEESIEDKLLTEVVKIMCRWKLPALSDSVYLIEAVFNALLLCGAVTKKGVLHWFENSVADIPDRISVIMQLLPWKKWLLGESLQNPQEPSEHESEESEEDIDIEALVPKPIRLTKTMMY